MRIQIVDEVALAVGEGFESRAPACRSASAWHKLRALRAASVPQRASLSSPVHDVCFGRESGLVPLDIAEGS